jgi:hypothetical protein
MSAEQRISAPPAATENWDAALPPRPDPAAPPVVDRSRDPEAEIERQAAIMRAAARAGSWETVERAGRAIGTQWVRVLFRRLLAALRR